MTKGTGPMTDDATNRLLGSFVSAIQPVVPLVSVWACRPPVATSWLRELVPGKVWCLQRCATSACRHRRLVPPTAAGPCAPRQTRRSRTSAPRKSRREPISRGEQPRRGASQASGG